MSHVEKANEMDHSKAIRGYLGIFNLVWDTSMLLSKVLQEYYYKICYPRY